MALVGRTSERQVLEALLDQAARGLSGALVVRGEAGVGKTALLDATAESAAARGMQIARLTGIESETQLGYAALHRLLMPYSRHIDRLPGPQRDALRSTFGLVAGPADRFLVGLGVLTLLADVATEEPLLCLVDDGHWLDPETQVVLGFVARRLDADGIAMVLATRDMEPSMPSDPVPELVVGGLREPEAQELLPSVTEGTVSPYVADRLIAATGGNPLALVELARELTPDQLSGVSPLPEPLPVGHSLELVFSRQLNRLPPDRGLLLALAATEPSASQATLWRAAAQLGIDPDAAASSVGDLVAFTPQVTFRHPLVCSVAYHLTPVPQRRRIHQALADQGREPDRIAWHLGLATSGPDEAVAARLAETADRARERGGYAATVTFLARAAELSVSEDLRTRRLLAAAEAALAAGQPVRARALLDQAESVGRPTIGRWLRLCGSAVRCPSPPASPATPPASCSPPPSDSCPSTPRWDGERCSPPSPLPTTHEDVLEEVRAFAADLDETPLDLGDSVLDCRLPPLLASCTACPVRRTRRLPLLRAAIGHLRDPRTPDAIRMSVPAVVSGQAGAELMDENAAARRDERLRAIRSSNRRTAGARAGLARIGHRSDAPRPIRRGGSSLRRRARPRRSDRGSREPRRGLVDRVSSVVLARS